MGNSNPITPFQILEAGLGAEDDREFWRIALSLLTHEFMRRHRAEAKTKTWAMVIGVCSHWIRPHSTRWTAAGGFAYPGGYKDSMPALDWSLVFLFSGAQWIPAPKLPGKRITIFRVAIPARTSRHKQAVVQARWLPGEAVIFYGFRKLHGEWRCVAASDEASKGRLLAIE